jgi:hypothetical protein
MTLDLLDRKGNYAQCSALSMLAQIAVDSPTSRIAGKYSNGFCHWPQPAWRRPSGQWVRYRYAHECCS